MSRRLDVGGLALCSGHCFTLGPNDAPVAVACLAEELRRLRRDASELRLAPEVAPLLPRRPATQPTCGGGFALSAYGLRIAVRTNEPAVLHRVSERLPPSWRPAYSEIVQRLYSFVVPRRRGVHTLYGDAAALARGESLDDILDGFESDLQLYVAEQAPRHVFVHAGVVGWRGRAILLPGTSMSGKSRLVAELIRAGATYYSDEYAVLDATGHVHPYARPLSLRQDGLLQPRRYPVEALGGRSGRRALPVGLVVLASYRPGARWQPRPLAVGRGALALLNHAIAARRAPARVIAAIGEVAKVAKFLVGPRGEAEETARLLLTRD